MPEDRCASPSADATQDPLASLNAQQRAAVEHGCDAGPGAADPLLVIAGAGSGKTNTLAYRVAWLVARGADPQRLLLLTFSRRAAAEMERRAGRILQKVLGLTGQRPPALPWAGTFHSVGARLLREYAVRIGLSESFTIHDRSDAEDLLAIVRDAMGFARTEKRFPSKGTCLAIYSRLVNSEAALSEVLGATYPWCFAWEKELEALFGAYVAHKQAQNVLDYDDLLLYWSQMVAEPTLAEDLAGRFDHVLVDEYQDTNRLQGSILRALKPSGRGVTVVGDDAQAIYAFRAATVRNILDFPSQYPTPARVVTLERNYRSTQPILDASNAVIGLASERFTKNLWSERRSTNKPQLVVVRDEADQARFVAERILAHRESGIALKSQAVLFRSSSHSIPIELELARRFIPFVKYGGLRFLEAAHIKDVMSMLRWAENPRSRMAGSRVARLLPGIGPATSNRLLDALAGAADPVAVLRDFAVAPSSAHDWSQLATTFATLHARSIWPADIDIAARWYAPHLERLYDDWQARHQDLSQLCRMAATYASRERFLTELALDPPDASSDLAGPADRDDDYVILSTIHSAKGQEWRAVQVLNVVDGCIPSDLGTGTTAEIEEERRLLYVAMTRAKDHLDLLVPQRFYVHQQSASGDRHVYALRSRFIPDALLGRFECRSWPSTHDTAASHVVREPRRPVVDLAAKIRARFAGKA
ncbi:MAG TPA: ATP-dependent helicase [Casimicrobiaceae bacterium]|nr:ATP-dependent helicase [Casimicrobiaceae bacterium]